jgi:hypothetical protein
MIKTSILDTPVWGFDTRLHFFDVLVEARFAGVELDVTLTVDIFRVKFYLSLRFEFITLGTWHLYSYLVIPRVAYLVAFVRHYNHLQLTGPLSGGKGLVRRIGRLRRGNRSYETG